MSIGSATAWLSCEVLLESISEITCQIHPCWDLEDILHCYDWDRPCRDAWRNLYTNYINVMPDGYAVGFSSCHIAMLERLQIRAKLVVQTSLLISFAIVLMKR